MPAAGATAGKADKIRRAAPLIIAMVENYERRLEQERAASSPARSASRASSEASGDLSKRGAA